MPARPRSPQPPKPPKPWRREEGRYRSSDDRFTVEGGGAGRWFLTDDASPDELGLARTMGPYDTLDDAKAAADAQRERGSEASPLADRLAAAKDRPSPAAPKRGRQAPTAPANAGPSLVQPPVEPAPPPPPTWLDELEEQDRPGAARARRLIDQLTALGVADAEGVVRRDVLGGQPAIAGLLLARTLADALRGALEPAVLAAAARAAIPGPMRTLSKVDDADLAAYAALVAARVLDATLDVVTTRDRAEDAGRDLPGWRLVERPGTHDAETAPRRLIVTSGDVSGA